MKKITNNFAAIAYRSAAFFAGAAIFILLLFGFKSQQTRTEKLLGVSFNYDKKEISIQVVSSGCTVKTDFQFNVSNNIITIIRKKRDECKAMPGMTSFTYTFLETGLSPDKAYTIKNKFIANPNLANIP